MDTRDTDILYKPSKDEEARGCRQSNRLFIMFALVSTGFIIAGAFLFLSRFSILTPPLPDDCRLGPDICEPATPFTPEQLHLSLGADDHQYYVTWSTVKPVDTYLVWEAKSSGLMMVKKGLRLDGDFESDNPAGKKYKKHSYRASMTVEVDLEYNYRVVSCVNNKDEAKEGVCDNLLKRGKDLISTATYTSRTYTFRTKPFDNPNRMLNLLFYGDLGLLNAQSVPRLTEEIEQNDLIIHNGDFAYDLNTKNGQYGDRFMRLMEPIAAKIPYQTSVGNHEIAGNFSEYNHRFTMLNRGPINHGSQNNFFYSFNAGPVHFIAFSTEFYYFLKTSGLASLVNQYNWLVEDLKHANSPEERALRPWIIVFGHRPMYCSSRDGDDCAKDSNILRKGLPQVGGFALEKLFYEFGVDIEMYSHEHQYERFLPVYDGRVCNGSFENPYHNTKAPVHVISGSAGCEEKLDPFMGHPAPGSIVRLSDYGYTRLKATKCRLEFEQISDDKSGHVVDHFVVSKSNQHNFPIVGPILEGCL